MPTARDHLAVAAGGGVLVAIGGRNGAEIDGWMAGATEVFDPATGVWDWKERAVLPVPRSGMGVAATDDAVIVMGGEGIQGLYADVNRYDVASNSWSTLPDLPSGRHGAASAYIDGSLYAIGGSTLAWGIQSVAEVTVLEIAPN